MVIAFTLYSYHSLRIKFDIIICRTLWKNDREAIVKESKSKKYVDEEDRHTAFVVELNAKWNEETRVLR